MICQKCNFQNAEEARFCKNCGTHINPYPNKPPAKPYALKRLLLEIPIFVASILNVMIFCFNIDPWVRAWNRRYYLRGNVNDIDYYTNNFSNFVILSIISGTIAVLCLILSLKQFLKYKEEKKGIAKTTLIISSIETAILLLAWCFYFLYIFVNF